MSYTKIFNFDVDPGKVEFCFTDGTVLTIDRTAVECEFTNPYELGRWTYWQTQIRFPMLIMC